MKQGQVFKILMVTSEAVPFAKSGGLADMVGALSLELGRQGHDIKIFMPLYGNLINEEDLHLECSSFLINLEYRKERVSLYSTQLEKRVKVYFLKSEKYFDNRDIYGPTPASAYPDNLSRFALLSQGALSYIESENWQADIVHSHDWPTGLTPIYMKQNPFWRKSASLFTIHNMGYQGEFEQSETPWIGLTKDEVKEYKVIHKDRLNFLKAGIENSTLVTTVSPTYAKEIQKDEYACGLLDSLQRRKNDLYGVVNGVDYSIWNPLTDRYIAPFNYSLKTLSQKEKIKEKIQEKFGLTLDKSIPLYGLISRLVSQKGIDELCKPGYGILEPFCKNHNIQIIILGTGEPWCEEELSRLAKIYPNLGVKIGYSEELSHLIEAGSDFFLMPSHYEPCGLNQLYSLKYGTLPLVRKTGGLADTVKSFRKTPSQATGFSFDKKDPQEFLKTLEFSFDLWKTDQKSITKMKQRGMEEDFSWEQSSKDYLKLYERALNQSLDLHQLSD